MLSPQRTKYRKTHNDGVFDAYPAEVLAVACPYCTVMLDDGVQASGAALRVADVATLLAEAVLGAE